MPDDPVAAAEDRRAGVVSYAHAQRSRRSSDFTLVLRYCLGGRLAAVARAQPRRQVRLKPAYWPRGLPADRAWSGKRRASGKAIPPLPWWAAASTLRASRATSSSFWPSTSIPANSFGRRHPAAPSGERQGQRPPRHADDRRKPAVCAGQRRHAAVPGNGNRQAHLGIQYRREVRRQRSAMGIQRIAAGGWRSRHRHARRPRRSGCSAEQGYRRSPLEVAE